MLNTNQRKVLHALISPKLGNNPSSVQVGLYVGNDIAVNMPVVTQTSQLIVWMVDQALVQSTPATLIKLISSVDDFSGRAGSLIQLRDDLEADPSLWRSSQRGEVIDWSIQGDPLNIDDAPFIDREGFRKLLPRIGSETAADCILVSGNRGSGKSYLLEFCKALNKEREEFSLGFAALGSSGVPSMGPDTPAIKLAAGLKTDPIKEPRKHEDPHRYAQNLVGWICTHTPKNLLPAVIILDEFDNPDVPESIHTFIIELVRRIQSDPEVRARLHVVLLGYDAARLQQAGLKYEPYVLEFIDNEHVENWFKKRFPNRESYEYEDTVSMILERVPENGESRMQNLCARIQMASLGF